MLLDELIDDEEWDESDDDDMLDMLDELDESEDVEDDDMLELLVDDELDSDVELVLELDVELVLELDVELAELTEVGDDIELDDIISVLELELLEPKTTSGSPACNTTVPPFK